MPTPGLSLVGFMNQAEAINHLRVSCVPTGPDDDATLTAEWNAAKATLGAPIPRAGNPTIQPMPGAHQPHIQQLQQAAWAVPMFQGPWQASTFHLIEIETLLAYQFTVGTTRAAPHYAGLPNPPTVDQLLPICLPLAETVDLTHLSQHQFAQGRSIILKTKGLNFRILDQGLFQQANIFGIRVGPAFPIVQVLRFNGRCYLHNGFHRAYCARMAGATEMPCMLRDVGTADEVGIRTDGNTFPLALLESANPPTVGHFTQQRAHPVGLRAMTRILEISWADHVLPDE